MIEPESSEVNSDSTGQLLTAFRATENKLKTSQNELKDEIDGEFKTPQGQLKDKLKTSQNQLKGEFKISHVQLKEEVMTSVSAISMEIAQLKLQVGNVCTDIDTLIKEQMT